MIQILDNSILEKQLFKPDQQVAVISGLPVNAMKTANFTLLHRIGQVKPFLFPKLKTWFEFNRSNSDRGGRIFSGGKTVQSCSREIVDIIDGGLVGIHVNQTGHKPIFRCASSSICMACQRSRGSYSLSNFFRTIFEPSKSSTSWVVPSSKSPIMISSRFGT